MCNRIKILFTITNFETAGSGKVVYDLVNGLDKNKFEVEIACDHNRGAFYREMESLEVPIHLIKTTTTYRPYYSLIARVRTISKFLKDNNFNMLHSWHWSSDWTEVLACRMAGIKYIYTKKAMSWGNKHWKIKSYLSNFIITINDEMDGYFPKKKNQQLIPLGIDVEFYKPGILPTNREDKFFKIVTVANLVPVKGIEVLLKAVSILNDKEILLTVAGDNDNDYGKQLSHLCDVMDIQDQVMFLGKLADVRPIIEQADVYVIPTLDKGRKEGMPMALVEAMCMAIPVLGSDISGIKFVLKDFTDLLFPASNAEVLAAKLECFKNLSTQEREELGKSLRAYCLKNFTMSKFISEHEELYYKL